MATVASRYAIQITCHSNQLDKDHRALQIQRVVDGNNFQDEKSDDDSDDSLEAEIESKAPKEVMPTYNMVFHKEPGPTERPFVQHANTHIYYLWYCSKHREYIFRVCKLKYHAYFSRVPQELLNFKLNFSPLHFLT